MNKGEIARQYFLNGYNCAQAVALAFCDELALPPETALRLVSGFGGGMGGDCSCIIWILIILCCCGGNNGFGGFGCGC